MWPSAAIPYLVRVVSRDAGIVLISLPVHYFCIFDPTQTA